MEPVASAGAAYAIEWLGVPDRLETRLVPQQYPLHTVQMGGVQGGFGIGTLKLIWQFLQSTWQVRQLLQRGEFQGVFTTGGYIAAPAILAARSLGLPTILHESNALPGKVTRWLSPWCSLVALGFAAAQTYLPKAETVVVGTPVRSQFLSEVHGGLQDDLVDLTIPADAPVILVVGGSQGAVAVNRLVRQAAPAWLAAGAWVIHQTGENDPDADSLVHPHYIRRPFFHRVAALLQRATVGISRAGAGTLTELAITGTPSILIPYPFAAEDHQTYNARAFAEAKAAEVYQQRELSATLLRDRVLALLAAAEVRADMAAAARSLAQPNSAQSLADLISKVTLQRNPT